MGLPGSPALWIGGVRRPQEQEKPKARVRRGGQCDARLPPDLALERYSERRQSSGPRAATERA